MHFIVYRNKNGATFDHRNVDFRSIDHFEGLFSESATFEKQESALAYVREHHPDALALPIPIKIAIGSGGMFVLGVIAEPTETVKIREAEGAPIPFVMYVRAEAENDVERRELRQLTKKEQTIFSRGLWAVPSVEKPTGPTAIVPMTLRAKAEGFPVTVDAVIGLSQGRVAFWAEWAPGQSAVWLVDRRDLEDALRKVDARDRQVPLSGSGR